MIVFNNWKISCTGVIAQQYDNLTRKIEVIGKLPEGYEWSLLVQCNGNKDTLHMERTDNGAEVILSQDNLAVSGYYQLQLRGNLTEDLSKTRHTNVTQTFVPASLVGTGGWSDVPSEFLQIEQRILDLNAHPPVPGNDGFWHLWNGEEYVRSNIVVPVDPNGYSIYYTSESVSVQSPTMSVDSVELNGGTLRKGDLVITSSGCLYTVTRVVGNGTFFASRRCVLRSPCTYTSSESATKELTSLTLSAVALGDNTLYQGDFIVTANGRLYEVSTSMPMNAPSFMANLRCVLKGDPGNVLTAPDGTRYQLAVDNNGNLKTTEVID